MARLAATIIAFAVVLWCSGPAAADGLVYPETRRIDHVDDYHGTNVPDPYRWLEDDVRESDDVADWVEGQNEVTFGYLAALREREALERLSGFARSKRPTK